MNLRQDVARLALDFRSRAEILPSRKQKEAFIWRAAAESVELLIEKKPPTKQNRIDVFTIAEKYSLEITSRKKAAGRGYEAFTTTYRPFENPLLDREVAQQLSYGTHDLLLAQTGKSEPGIEIWRRPK